MLRGLADGAAHDGAEEVRARHVHVGEVGAVGLVHVVVHLEDVGVRRGDYGEEEGGWGDRRGLEVDVVEVGAKESNLLSLFRLLFLPDDAEGKDKVW